MSSWRLQYIEHAGFTVPHLDQAVQFFIDHLGAEELFRSERAAGPFVQANFAAPADGSFMLAMLRVTENLNIELFQWRASGAGSAYPRAFDVGGNHLCLHVDDVDAAVRYFEALPGVQARGGANTVSGGPVSGSHWGYVQTPWGMQLEFVNRDAVVDGPRFATAVR